jgi:DNA-binding NarL/FixJ family response regulator
MNQQHKSNGNHASGNHSKEADGGGSTGPISVTANLRDRQCLTGQEEKVLKLVAEAKTNKEIAVALCISPATVKRHLENILRKLNLKNRVSAAVFAVSEKLSVP